MQRRRKNRNARPRPANPKLVLLNKPYGVLSQFSGEPGDATLKDWVPHNDVYPAGRLDKDSEGLMLLTNDGVYQARLADPKYKVWKTYWVQVEGEPSQEQLLQLIKKNSFLPLLAILVFITSYYLYLTIRLIEPL